MNHVVGSHGYGNWDATPFVLLAPYNSLVKLNDNPAEVSATDTYWSVDPDVGFRLPENTYIVKPSNDVLFHIGENIATYKTDNFTDEVGTNGYPSLVYTNPAGTSLVTGLKARILWNSRANATSWVTLNDEGGTYTFTSSTLTSTNINSMLSACPNSNTLPVEFDLQSTLNGTEYHYYKSATMTVVNANPTSGAVTYADTDSTTIGKTGSNQIIVQGQSVLRIASATSTAKKSATIVSYSLNFNNTTTDITSSKTATISNPNYAGVYTATVTTTDSRGNTSTASTNIVIYELVAPSAIYSLKRVDNFYTNTTLFVNGQISSINGTNTLSIKERHKKTTDTSWSSYSNVPNATNTTLSLDNAYNWEVEIVVSDEYSSTTYTASVGVGLPVVFFDKKRHSMGINGFPDADNQLYVNGTIKSTGDIATSGRVTCSKMSSVNENVTFSKSSGSWTFNSGEYTRSGQAVQIRLGFKGGGSNVSVGSNSIVGTINGIPLPSYTVRLFGYYSGTALMGELTSSGGFNVRILGVALNLSTSNTATLSGTYIVED